MCDELQKEWCAQDSVGQTKMHKSAKSHAGKFIPKELLTEENLMITNNLGMTVLHYLAFHGEIEIVPITVLTAKNLVAKNIHGDSILHYSAKGCTLGSLPDKRNLLTKERMLATNTIGETVLHHAAKCFAYIPSEVTSQEAMLQKNISGVTPLHNLAQAGNLNLLPYSILTLENLTIADSQGNTPIHCLAKSKNASSTASYLRTFSSMEQGRQVLGIPNNMGTTPVHNIAHCIGAVREWLNTELLLLEDNQGITPLELVVHAGEIEQIFGITLPEKAKKTVGKKWWCKNNELVQAKTQVNVSSVVVEISMF